MLQCVIKKIYKVGLEMDKNETLIRRIISSKVDKDEYTDVIENDVCTVWYIQVYWHVF